MASVGYEWDPGKAKLNLRKHGIRFADAVAVLEDEFALTVRDTFSEQEERWCVWQLLLVHFGGLIWPTLGRCEFGEAF
jgi:uncharacterized DUF497 family protein